MSEEAPKYEVTAICEAPEDGLRVKIKKLHPDAVIPTKATPQSACYDVYAPCDFVVRQGRSVMPLGFAIELSPGYCAEIRPRSGYSSKGFAGILADTGYRFDADVIHGCVDSDYRGEIGVIIKSSEMRNFTIKRGQRIAQMFIQRAENVLFEVAEELSDTVRGTGGYGSSGL